LLGGSKGIASSRQKINLAGTMTELPRWVLTHAEKLNKLGLIRVDLHRSLQRHPWLSLGAVMSGTVLAGLYLVTSWPDIATPAHLSTVIFDAAVILLSAVVLGIAVAVMVQSTDQKVYSGADIEYMLGVEPMVELPDLAELSNDETRELLLPLAGGIIHACPDGALRRCIFTGTGPEAGVTAIVAKTKETLEDIGRRVVLVDAAGATPGVPDAEINRDETEGEGANRRESLILTETAPLVSSADTEYLARFADCVIVVAESGVTTRDQLRNTVKSLQRLNVAAVGFVLNRVKEAKASVELRRLAAASDISSAQFSAAVERALAHPERKAAAPAKAAPRPRPAASLTSAKETPKPATALATVKRAPQSSAWEQPGIPRWLSDALGELDAPHRELTGVQASGRAADATAKKSQQEVAVDDTGSKPLETGTSQATLDRNPNGSAARPDQAEPSSGNSKDSNGGDGTEPETAQAMSPPVASEASDKKPSRLSGLRGMVSAAHLRELKRPEVAADETTSRPDDFRRKDAKNELPARLPSDSAEASNGSATRLDDLRGLITPENLKDLSQARRPLAGAGESVERGNGSTTQDSESLPVDAQAATGQLVEPEVVLPLGDLEQASSMASETNGAKEAAGAKDTDAPTKPTVASDRERVAPYDEVQVLPSRSGQYRRK
jgi:hypothetical protein